MDAQPRQADSTPAAQGAFVSFEDLERIERWCSDSYESLWGAAEAGLIEFDHAAEPIVRALRLIRTILAENAA